MKMNLKSIALTVLLATASAHAQGKLFTWYNYGQPHNFQASFQVTDAEYALGWPYYPGLYPPPSGWSPPPGWNPTDPQPFVPNIVNSFSFSAPDYTSSPSLQLRWFPETTPDNYPNIGPEFTDATYNRELYITSSKIVYSITTPGQESTIEQNGWWQVTIIPEPSACALLGVGLLALYIKKAASR